jgi:hypothetical protein
MHILNVPRWDQLNDPDANGGLDPLRTNDCGEECAAELLYYWTGQEVSAFQIRLDLPGHAESAQTTGADIAGYLRSRGIPAMRHEVPPGRYRKLIGRQLESGSPCALLGYWIAPNILHWVVAKGYGQGLLVYNDPWGGVVQERSWQWVLAHAEGTVVLTAPPKPTRVK